MPEYATIAQLAARSGTSVPCAGNLPVDLDDPDSVWFIDQGIIDLFLVEFRDGVEAAAPQHLLRCESGRLLWGVAPDEQDNNRKDTTLRVIAKGLPGTLLKRLPASLLSDVHPAELTTQADTWLTAVTETLSRLVSHLPRATALAEPGVTQTLAPCTLSVRRGVVWVSRPPRGVSLFMDMIAPVVELAEASSAPEATIPLTRTAWLTLFGEATLSGKSTETLARQGMLLPALASFHRLAFAVERLNRRLAVVDEANLERERTASRRTAERAARQRLFNIYDLPMDREATAEDTALADALKIIGRHQGIDFRIPARSGPSGAPVSLIDVLDASGVRARRVRFKGEGNWWRGDSNAMLAFRAEDGQPVALLPGTFGRYREVDPVSKRSVRLTEERAGALQNEAWVFYPPLPSENVKPADLMRIALRGSAADLARLVIAGLPGGLIKLLPALALGFVANHVVAGGSAGALYAVTATLAGFGLLGALLHLFQSSAMMRLEGRSASRVEAAFWDRLMRLPPSVLHRHPAGDLAMAGMTFQNLRDGLQGVVADGVAEVAEYAKAVAAEAEERFPGIDLRTVGTVMVNQTFVEASIRSQMIFLPASLLLMALILGVLTRGWAGVAATGMVIVFSVLASIGLGVWAGLPFSPPISPAPTIVLMIVVANCVHLLVALQQRLGAGNSRHDAIVESIGLNLHPVFLASLTTALGFLSMNFSEVPPYRHLGNFVAFGVVASFLLSVTFLPAVLSLLPVRAAKDRQFRGSTLLADTVLRYRKAIIWGWLVIVAAMALAIPRNELNDVLVHFFDKSVEFRQDTDFMDDRLSGNTVLEYSLQAPAEGGVTDPRFLADVANFADWYRKQPPVRHVAVITDTFQQLNQSMHGNDPAAYRIPESKELAAQYLVLYELSLPQGLNLNNQIDRSRSATRMTISAETLSSRELLELNARAEAWLKENAPHVGGVNSTGPAALFAYIGQRNIRAMMVGTMVVLLAISAILLFALRSLRLGLISIAPNLVPAVLGFGVWGLTVGQVGLSLSVVVAMTVGIVVDDTVHFLSKYRRARREYGQGPEEAVRYAFDTAGQAMLTTTVVLVAGFLILVFSPFVPTAQVGVLTAMIIGFALLADLTLLPALLAAMDRSSAVPSKT